jgi:hypothetical protein
MKAQFIASYPTIAILFVGLSVPVVAQNPDLVHNAPPACGGTTAQFQVSLSDTHTDPQVDPGRALIYLVEEQKFRLFHDVTVRVGLDGAWVGATRGTSHLSFAVEPGEHHLCVDFLSDFLEPGRLVSLYGFTAEAGKTYYFRARTMASTSGSRRPDSVSLDLDLVNDDQGKLLVANSPVSVSHPKQ